MLPPIFTKQSLVLPHRVPSYSIAITGDPVMTYTLDHATPRPCSNKLFLSAYYTPVIRYLHRAGVYTWILIVLLSYLIYRKKYKEIICFVPVVVMLLTNIASPVNGSIRYTMPIMAALPVLWGFVLSHVGREPQGQTEK